MTTTFGGRGMRILAALLATAAAAGGAVAVASPAQAASSGVQLSDDGVHFSSTLSRPLFDPSTVMIPRSSQSGDFWVRNASGAPAYLRVSIANVQSTDADLSEALTVSASTSGDAGSKVALSEAAPCAVLTEGQAIPSGAALRISALAELGDLQGSAGQGGSADFRIVVNLSSVNLAGTDRYACLADSGEVPGFYADGGSAVRDGGRTSTTGSTGGVVDAAPLAETGDDDGAALAGGSSSASDDLLAAAWNSADLNQWWIVLLWIGGALAGGLGVLLRDRLRTPNRSTPTTTPAAASENGTE
ncbi:hypothetical protein [Schumannella sp. 10F1B-5-1]|uniref:hypothetical protein n=1 Tax=Schumannella sp. 10F1B-5-1 TaxID=2590780 RepID=UPI00113064AD|nr:hypothetical protein [Schumannella sp. 10F1B-5-1]TPW70032.1 hypothetical protein FJ658_13415 [Schumannella sp. 10F1B-5-1]